MKHVLVISVALVFAAVSAHAGTLHGSPAEIISMSGPGMGAFVQTPSAGTAITRTPINAQPNPCPPRPVPNQVWIPGYYTVAYRQVWIPPQYVDRWIPPVYGHQLVRGQAYYVMIQAGYYQRVLAPGYYDIAPFQIWVPGQWVCRY